MGKKKNIETFDIQLRKADREDLLAVKELVDKTIDASYKDVYPAEAIEFFKNHHAAENIKEDLAEEYVVVLELDSKIIGTGTLAGNEIGRVFVKSEFQGKDFGKAIMEKLEQKAFSKGIRKIKLDSSLPAYEFYKSLGYRTIKKEMIEVGKEENLKYFAMEKNKQIEQVKEHFEQEAKEFDQIILKLIPFYKEMVEALAAAIPFETDKELQVIDLGCGTGTILKQIQEKFPNAKLTCLDLSEQMIEMTKLKLKGQAEEITCYVEDFYDFEFKKKYDVIVSSLALHHLTTDEDKKMFYQKIYNALSKGGVFYNADVVLASSVYLQEVYMKKWIEYMEGNCSREEIESKWLPKYKAEDNPAELLEQIKWLEEIGFNDIDVVWKYYNYAVYGGQK